MSNVVKIKRRNASTAAPALGDLVYGELALNSLDGKLYFRRHVDGGGNDVVEVLADYSPSGKTWDES